MELKNYFKKIKETETSLDQEFPLIVSLETSNGGKPGTVMEVSRQQAAKAIVEGRAVLANDEQKQSYLKQESARRAAVEKAELSRRVQIAIISEPERQTVVSKDEKEEEPKGSR
jgi:hypothetical protein